MIVPAAPVVPGNENRRVGSVRTVSDCIGYLRHPGWTGAIVGGRMVGRLAGRNDPANVGKVPTGDIGQNLGLADHRVVVPLVRIANQYTAYARGFAHVSD